VVLLGSLGILFSIVLYSSLFFLTFGGKNNMITDMQKQMALGNLRQCVMNLEFYRQVHGAYPEKLETLADNQHPFNMGGAMLFDQTSGLLGNMKAQLFYYERTADGKGYFLLGRGPDGLPFTQDDVLPELSKEELTQCGFRKK
jgi:hypothetical protein